MTLMSLKASCLHWSYSHGYVWKIEALM